MAQRGQLRQARFDFGRWETENNPLANGLPIKAALSQTFELLKTPQPATISVEQNSDNHVCKTGRASPIARRIS